jgi:methyltransferase (TIGR00027 family)
MVAREPSFTAMAHAYARSLHAEHDPSPIFSDTRSVQLVPADAVTRSRAFLGMFSPAAAEAFVLMSVARHRVLADELPRAHARGVRQLVVLSLPPWGAQWRVFEVDEPATQTWKRTRIAELGWELPQTLSFVPCDFERRAVLDALEAGGFDTEMPALVSLFGVLMYLGADAASATLVELGRLAEGSKVVLTYSVRPDGSDPDVQEAFALGSPVTDSTGESATGYYPDEEMERMVRDAGFADVVLHSLEELNGRYFGGVPRLRAFEQILTAIR